MDKEVKEMLKELNELLGDLLEGNEDKLSDRIQENISKAYKEKAKISIEKNEDGTAVTHIEGSNTAILIALAGLEKTIMEKLNVPKGFYELVKKCIGTEEVK